MTTKEDGARGRRVGDEEIRARPGRRILSGAAVTAFCLLAALIGSARGAGPGYPGQQDTLLALRQLQSDFHGAAALGDYDLMYSLWADDAVFSGGGVTKVGPKAITDFMASGAIWGRSVGLTPSYKMTFDLDGDTARFRFECVYVYVGGANPLTTALSTIPPGGQNPAVEIVQHSNASCTAVRRHGRWVLRSFTGSAGAIQ